MVTDREVSRSAFPNGSVMRSRHWPLQIGPCRRLEIGGSPKWVAADGPYRQPGLPQVGQGGSELPVAWMLGQRGSEQSR